MVLKWMSRRVTSLHHVCTIAKISELFTATGSNLLLVLVR